MRSIWPKRRSRWRDHDPRVLRYAAHVLAYLERDFRRSLDLAEKAMMLSLESADVVIGNAWSHTYACLPHQAMTLFQRAMRLDVPRTSRSLIPSGLALANFVAGDYAEALKGGERCIVESPHWARSYRFAAISLAHMKRPEKVALMGRRMLAVTPEFRISQQINPLRDGDAALRFARGLETAQLPL